MKYFFSDEQAASSSPSPTESPVRTLAARKAYDEPLDISIQRKVNEKFDDDDFKKSQRYCKANEFSRLDDILTENFV